MTIDGADLAAIRAEAQTFLVQSALIRRRIVATDGRGGQIEDWVDLAAGVPCRLDEGSGAEARIGERQVPTQTWRAKFPYDQDLRETDRVIVDGIVFEVAYVMRRPFDAYRQADLVRR